MKLGEWYRYYIQKIAPINTPQQFYGFMKRYAIHLMAPLIGKYHRITYL